MTSQWDLDQQFEALAQRLPPRFANVLRWLWEPSRIWVRVPLAAVLVIGGFLSFLPVLGIWMLPLGLVLVARDTPPLQAPVARMLAWIAAKWPERQVHRSPGAE